MDRRGILGVDGEGLAASYLMQRGYEIVERNFRCRSGEIDIVARRDDEIVFCEVKTRRTDRWGAPSEAVNAAKQARIRRVAATWLAERSPRCRGIRFDVISVTTSERSPAIEHIAGAF